MKLNKKLAVGLAAAAFWAITPYQATASDLLFEALLDEIPLNSCPLRKSEGDKICSKRQEGESDYEWKRRVEKEATESARSKFKNEHGEETCPAENGACLKCKMKGEKKEGTCKFNANSLFDSPSEIPGTRSTTYNDETDEICSQVTIGCSYTCKEN